MENLPSTVSQFLLRVGEFGPSHVESQRLPFAFPHDNPQAGLLQHALLGSVALAGLWPADSSELRCCLFSDSNPRAAYWNHQDKSQHPGAPPAAYVANSAGGSQAPVSRRLTSLMMVGSQA